VLTHTHTTCDAERKGEKLEFEMDKDWFGSLTQVIAHLLHASHTKNWFGPLTQVISHPLLQLTRKLKS